MQSLRPLRRVAELGSFASFTCSMKSKLKTALKKRKPNEFLDALMACFPYSQPSDFRSLSADGRLVVCCNCFAYEMFSGGYWKVLANLPEWADEIVKSLKRIKASPYAETFAKVVRKAKAEGLVFTDETDWCAFSTRHGDFATETARDYWDAVDVVARNLRDYISKHASTFGKDAGHNR
jgi:hypothetical protein